MDSIAEYRKANGQTLQQVATRLGISKGYASDLERRLKFPSLDLATRIEREFGIPASKLGRG